MSGVVIKANDSKRLAGGLYGLDLRDIAGQAESMLTSAGARADRILADARREAERHRALTEETARREGFDKGLAEGRLKGLEDALAEARERFARDHAELGESLSKLIGELNRRREELYTAARRDVVVLAIAIASRLCRRFSSMAELGSDVAIQAAREALDLVREPTNVVLRVHPDDSAAVGLLAESVTAAAASARHVRIVEDAAIDRGGAVVETEDSRIDATISSRIERIADELVTDWRRRQKELSIES